MLLVDDESVIASNRIKLEEIEKKSKPISEERERESEKSVEIKVGRSGAKCVRRSGESRRRQEESFSPAEHSDRMMMTVRSHTRTLVQYPIC